MKRSDKKSSCWNTLVSAWYVVRRPDLNYETSLVYEVLTTRMFIL